MKKQKQQTIVDSVKTAVRKLRRRHISSDRLAELERLTQEMTAKGLLKRQNFGLPPIDTVGKTAFGSPEISG
jgi:hypothetical protein